MNRAVILLCLIFALSSCSKLFFYPDRVIRVTPKHLGLEYDQVKLTNQSGNVLTGWLLKSKMQSAKARILFLHGNAENISTHINSVYWLPEYGFEVLMAEYSGYGMSEGQADLVEIHEDAKLFLNHLLQCENCPPTIIYGQSLGGSVAIWLAANTDNTNVCKVIVEGAFADYQKMARDSLRNLSIFKYIFYPFTLFIRNDYSAKYFIAKINYDLLLIHGTSDQIVSSFHSKDLHKLKSDSKLWLVKDKGHLDIFRDNVSRAEFIKNLACSNQ